MIWVFSVVGVDILGVSGNCRNVNSLDLVLVGLFSVWAADQYLTKKQVEDKYCPLGLIVYCEIPEVKFLEAQNTLKSVLIVCP